MSLLQQPVQAKLSKLIGAEVRFGNFSVSLLGGSIEARGVTVAGDDPSQPVLTIRRVRVEISIPRALKKEIVVKSLTIEGPVLSIVKRAGGRTNLPRPGKGAEAERKAVKSAARAKAVDESAEGGDDAGGAWTLEAQRMLLVDGAVRYHADALAGGEAIDLSAESILAEVKAANGGLDFTCIVESLGSRGVKQAELGQLKFAGRAEGVEDLSRVLKASVTATVQLGELLRGEVRMPSIKPLKATFHASGAAEVSKLLRILPNTLASRAPATPTGRVEVSLGASYSDAGLKISELVLRAADVQVKT